MSFRVEIAARAIADADAAYVWIAGRSPEAAERWYRELFRQIETLAEHPLRCPLAVESPKYPEDIRELLYGGRRGKYRILFTVREDVVVVLTIHHGARDEADL